MKTFTLFFIFGGFTAIFWSANALSILKIEPTTYGANEGQTSANQPLNGQYANEEFGDKKADQCLESSEFKLNSMTWKVKVCKRKFEEGAEKKETKNYASVELESVFTDDIATWTCEAEAAVTLIGIKAEGKDKEDIKGEIKAFTYKKSSPLNKNEKFIELTKLEEYFANDVATFDFNVKTKSPDRSNKLEQTTAKFQLRVKQVNTSPTQYSNELIVRGIRWSILTTKLSDSLAISVLANENDIDTNAKWAVSAKIKLLSSKKDSDKSREFTDQEFSWATTNYGYRKYLGWDEFTKEENGYVQNNAALLEIELSVKPKPSE